MLTHPLKAYNNNMPLCLSCYAITIDCFAYLSRDVLTIGLSAYLSRDVVITKGHYMFT